MDLKTQGEPPELAKSKTQQLRTMVEAEAEEGSIPKSDFRV